MTTSQFLGLLVFLLLFGASAAGLIWIFLLDLQPYSPARVRRAALHALDRQIRAVGECEDITPKERALAQTLLLAAKRDVDSIKVKW